MSCQEDSFDLERPWQPTSSWELLRHPMSEGRAIRRVSVSLWRSPHQQRLRYTLHGRVARLALPTTPLDEERLWEHTCAEMFVADVETPNAYTEWNFSPTGQNARFRFTAYRQRSESGVGDAVTVVSERSSGAFTLKATGDFDLSSGEHGSLALSVIAREREGAVSFWALGHPAGRPDFHHPVGFQIRLRSNEEAEGGG